VADGGRTLRDILGAEGAVLYEDPEAYVRLHAAEMGRAPGTAVGLGRGPRENIGWDPNPAVLLDGDGVPLGAGGETFAVSPGPGLAQVGAEALGSLTGAPPRSTFNTLQVSPRVNGRPPVLVVDAARASRVAVLTAPLVGFVIWVGDSGVQVGQGIPLPPGLPYDIVIPGLQEIFAITDAPTILPLRIQVSPLLIGDRERRY